MTGHQLEIAPLSREHWVLRYAGDVTPLSEHRTLAEARAMRWLSASPRPRGIALTVRL